MASRRNNRVGVDADENFLAAKVLQSKIKRFGLAGVRLGQDEDPAAGRFERQKRARDFQRPVAGAVINHDDMQIGIVGGERCADGAHDNFFFVVRGDQHCNLGKIVGRVARQFHNAGSQKRSKMAKAPMKSRRPVMSTSPTKKIQVMPLIASGEEPEAKQVQARRPSADWKE